MAGIPTFRFAPSPNGYLHLGHAYSALLNQALARQAGGRLLLRLEDIDRERCRPQFIAAIEEDLDWLGLRWAAPVWVQSAHLAAHAAALDRLAERRLAYPCFCSRGEWRAAVADRPRWPRDPDGVPLYPGTCRHLSAAERRLRLASDGGHAMRLDMAAALADGPGRLEWLEHGQSTDEPEHASADPAVWGDVQIARRDVRTSYHLAVVLDDAAQGVTDVVRGLDLYQATSVHRLLQHLIGLEPPRYHHHRLISDADGAKLSKSRNSPALRDLRRSGRSPEDVRQLLGFEEGLRQQP